MYKRDILIDIKHITELSIYVTDSSVQNPFYNDHALSFQI